MGLSTGVRSMSGDRHQLLYILDLESRNDGRRYCSLSDCNNYLIARFHSAYFNRESHDQDANGASQGLAQV